MIFVSVILLIRSLRGASSLYAKQTATIIVTGLVPVVIEFASQFVPRLRGGSFTPVVFVFTGVMVVLGTFSLSIIRYNAHRSQTCVGKNEGSNV